MPGVVEDLGDLGWTGGWDAHVDAVVGRFGCHGAS